MSRSRPLLSIIVVTMDTPRVTRGCLRSVVRHTTVPYELIVVNNSRAKRMRTGLKILPIHRLIQNPRNFGYTKAANQGWAASRGEYICFLNSDTLVPPRWAERLLDALQQPGVGAVVPVTSNRRYGFPFPYQWPPKGLKPGDETTFLVDQAFQRWHYGRVKEMVCISGYCLMIPRAVMVQLGPFDERFYFGWEDTDYCQRLRLAGYRILQIQSVFVYHQGSASINEKKRQKWLEASKIQFLAKWQELLEGSFSDYRNVFSAVSRKLNSAKRGKRKDCQEILQKAKPLLQRKERFFISSATPRSVALPMAT